MNNNSSRAVVVDKFIHHIFTESNRITWVILLFSLINYFLSYFVLFFNALVSCLLLVISTDNYGVDGELLIIFNVSPKPLIFSFSTILHFSLKR